MYNKFTIGLVPSRPLGDYGIIFYFRKETHMKLKKLLVTGMALLASVTAFTSVAQAATSSQVQKVIDESYVQPDYVMGYSLSEEQRN